MIFRTIRWMLVCAAVPSMVWAADEAPKLKKGPLQLHAKAIGKLIKIKWDGKRVRLDRDHWGDEESFKAREKRKAEIIKKLTGRGLPEKFAKKQAQRLVDRAPIEEAFANLRKSAGSFRSSMSGTGSGLYKSFSGKNLIGEMIQTDDRLTLRVMEMGDTERSLQVTDSSLGSFGLTITDPAGNLVVVLAQQDNGKVKLVHVQGEEVHHYKAETFLELYREHTHYVNELLFPVIRGVGVSLPLGPYDERIVSAVISRLRGRLDEKEKKQVHKTLDDLEAADYPTRQSATELLKKNYLRWRPVIKQAMKDRKFSREAKSRLEGIIEANAQADQYGEIIDGLKLLDRPSYLVALMERSKGDNRKAVLRRLREVTRQDIGDDVEAWNAWLAEQEKK